VYQNNSLALYRNVNQASPPSMLPPQSTSNNEDVDIFMDQSDELASNNENADDNIN